MGIGVRVASFKGILSFTDDRVRKDVPPPEWVTLSSSRLFKSVSKISASESLECLTLDDSVPNSPAIFSPMGSPSRLVGSGPHLHLSQSAPSVTPNLSLLREHLRLRGVVSKHAMCTILESFLSLCKSEPNVLTLSDPIHIFGDIHGQYYDLIHMLESISGHQVGGEHRYLFLGDYVDRGPFSVEVCLLLFAMKVAHPNDVFLLRGNHECKLLCSHFSFQKECVQKYGQEIFGLFLKCFAALPLAALIHSSMGKVLCVHGGLSPSVKTVDDIQHIDRFVEVPNEGALCDLLWSDPLGDDTAEDLSGDEFNDWWGLDFCKNPSRGCAFVFGYKSLRRFLDANDLVCLVRGHEVHRGGFFEHFFFKKEERQREWQRGGLAPPFMFTIFSCPNYCDMYGNLSSALSIANGSYSVRTFTAQPHPFVLPTLDNAINYTLPFVMEHLLQFFLKSTKYFVTSMGLPDDLFEKYLQNMNVLLKLSQTIVSESTQSIEERKNLSLISDPYLRFDQLRKQDKLNESLPGSVKALNRCVSSHL
jgi:serine/threonine-protein phosphatase 2B catalytic subunit